MAANPTQLGITVEKTKKRLILESLQDCKTPKEFQKKLLQILPFLRNETLDKLVKLFSDGSITEIGFEYGELTPTELQKVVCLLSLTNVTSINLEGYSIGYGFEKTIVSFAGILSKSLTNLNLSRNSLFICGPIRLPIAMRVLPKLLTTLNLADNNLGRLGAKGLTGIFRELPSLTSLNLADNNLGWLGTKGAKGAKRQLPSSLISLNLADNNLGWLGTKGAKGAKGAKRQLPASLISLNLANNHLGKPGLKGAESLADVFRALPKSLVSLNLEGNTLRQLSDEDLKDAFKPLQGRKVKLFLDRNCLNDKLINELEEKELGGQLTKAIRSGSTFFPSAASRYSAGQEAAVTQSTTSGL